MGNLGEELLSIVSNAFCRYGRAFRNAPPVCCCEGAIIGAPPLWAPGLGAPWSGGSPEGNCGGCCTAGPLVAALFCVGGLLAVAGAERLLLAANGLLLPASSMSAFDKLFSDSKYCQYGVEMKHQQDDIISHSMPSKASSKAANHPLIIQSQQSWGLSFAFIMLTVYNGYKRQLSGT